jgi:hypothetical protein
MKDYIDSVVIIGLLISILLGILGTIAIPNNAQFGFLIGLLSITITILIDISAKLSRNIKIHEESDQKLLKIIKDQISARVHDSEIFNEIIDDFFRQFRVNLGSLSRGYIDVGNGYFSTNDLFRCGSGAIERSQKQVLAVEAGSDCAKWTNKSSFQNYHNLTVKAVRRGVKFVRIWIINQNEADYHDVWKQHRQDGIKTYFVHESDLSNSLGNLDYLDFAIIDEQILLKSRINNNYGQNKKYEGGTISIVKEDLEIARKRFNTLKSYAREYID